MTELQRSLFAMGRPAVDAEVTIDRVHLDEASWVDVGRSWLRGADDLLEHLVATVPWQRGRRWMYDHEVEDPRLHRGFRDEDVPHPALEQMRVSLQRHYRVPLHGVALQLYRDGRDSVAPHRDREMKYLEDTVVAIVSLGARRPFLVTPFRGGRAIDLAPASGDLLVMGGRCQVGWRHGVPKVARAGPRISATWRWTSRRGERDRSGSWRSPRHYGKG